jgi:hypothetical protein
MEKTPKAYTTIRLSPDAGVKDVEQLSVYVLNKEGNVIEESSFKGLEANLKTGKHALREHRVYIGLRPPEGSGIKQADRRYLEKSGAFELVQHFTRDNVIDVSRIPQLLPIPFRFCNINGHVNKNFIIDGVSSNHPICHARVHICEVDICRRWPHLPDWVVIDIRDKFRKVFVEKLDPRPPVIPDPIGPIAQQKLKLPLKQLKATAMMQERSRIQALPVLENKIQSGILSDSLDTVKETLQVNHRLLYPYFCLWPAYWPRFYCHQEIGTVYTDCNGKFSHWHIFFGPDQPDIYIWVEVLINGNWVTVYRPSLPCNTWWNYPCGTNINITVTDTRVTPCVCNPLAGSMIWVKRVGDGTSIRRIALQASAAATPSPFPDVRGLTNSTGVEGNNYVSPFTKVLPLVLQFGDGFPSGAVTHFRWKHRRIANADLASVTESYQPQEGALTKPYTYQGTNAAGNPVFYTGAFILDATIASGKIYRIPHVEASVDTGIPTAEWDQDTVSMYFNAENELNGLFEFVLELCDGAGNTQTIGQDVFLVDSLMASPNPPTIPARDIDANYLVRNISGDVVGFRFLVRIDNDETTCNIDNAIVRNADGTGSTTDTECGFAEYRDKNTGRVLLRFDAHQNHRYARYDFNVVKGNGGSVISASGQVPEPSSTTTVNGLPVVYQLNPTLLQLLGSCTQAAFAEHLYVTAYHTNGSVRIQQYDSSDIAAFAVEPV